MPLKLVLSSIVMVAIAVIILSLAIGGEKQQVTGSANKIITMTIPAGVKLSRFDDMVSPSCQNSAELLAIEHSFDSARLAQLTQSLQQLHNRAADRLWQPLFDLFSPKSIGLSAADFSIDSSADAVTVNRQVKRLIVNYPDETGSSNINLSYDVQLPESGSLEVLINTLSERRSLSIPVTEIRDSRYLSRENTLLGGQISDCVTEVLPELLPELNWQTATLPEESYCLLWGEYQKQQVIKFYVDCPVFM